MKIGIIAVGTRGDVQPCVALAKTLNQNGIENFIATHKEFKEFVKSNGITFYELPGNPSQDWEKNKERQKLKLEDQFYNYGLEWIDAINSFSQGIDALIYTPLFFLGPHIAEQLKAQPIGILFEPNFPTNEFASPYFTFSNNLGRTLNKISHKFAYYSLWFKIKKIINKLRLEKMKLDKSDYFGNFSKKNISKINYLGAYSNFIAPKPKDWKSNIAITGYWYLDEDEEYFPEKKLQNYVKENKNIIYFDFGSFAHDALIPIVKKILIAIKNSKLPLIFDSGNMNIEALDLPNNSIKVDRNVPHSWLLPQISSMITMSGVGAVHAAMKNGVPIIPIPMFPAQTFWGRLVWKKNCGSEPVNLRKVNKDQILNSIKHVQNLDTSNCLEIAKNINSENGCDKAVKQIKAWING